VLVSHPGLKKARALKVEEIVLALESVIHARGQCYLMMNARRECLEEIRKALPGLSGPTVMEVASREDLVAVHAVVSEDRVYGLITRLKRAGARDILVMPIERMIR
jgi:ATP phosphoribosyltransferase